MKSLKELCQQNITNSIYNMPPMLQETVIRETKEQMREQIRKEMINEIREEENARKDMLDTLSYIIPDIMKDIVYSMTHNTESRENFYELWPHTPKDTISAAIMIAETAVNEIGDRYIQDEFSCSNDGIYMDTESSSDEE